MEVSHAQTLDWFLRQGAVLGLAFVFLAGVLALLLWVAASTVSVLRIWAPKWFKSSIETQNKVANSIGRLSKGVFGLWRRNNATQASTAHLLEALEKHFQENKERLGVSSDVLFHVRTARQILREEERNTREDMWNYNHQEDSNDTFASTEKKEEEIDNGTDK